MHSPAWNMTSVPHPCMPHIQIYQAQSDSRQCPTYLPRVASYPPDANPPWQPPTDNANTLSTHLAQTCPIWQVGEAIGETVAQQGGALLSRMAHGVQAMRQDLRQASFERSKATRQPSFGRNRLSFERRPPRRQPSDPALPAQADRAVAPDDTAVEMAGDWPREDRDGAAPSKGFYRSILMHASHRHLPHLATDLPTLAPYGN